MWQLQGRLFPSFPETSQNTSLVLMLTCVWRFSSFCLFFLLFLFFCLPNPFLRKQNKQTKAWHTQLLVLFLVFFVSLRFPFYFSWNNMIFKMSCPILIFNFPVTCSPSIKRWSRPWRCWWSNEADSYVKSLSWERCWGRVCMGEGEVGVEANLFFFAHFFSFFLKPRDTTNGPYLRNLHHCSRSPCHLLFTCLHRSPSFCPLKGKKEKKKEKDRFVCLTKRSRDTGNSSWMNA